MLFEHNTIATYKAEALESTVIHQFYSPEAYIAS
jgi:hypothetical protein